MCNLAAVAGKCLGECLPSGLSPINALTRQGDYLIPKVVRCSQGFSWGGRNSTFPLQWLTGIPCQGSIS